MIGKKVAFISSTGGHLTEIMRLKELFNRYDCIFITEKDNTTKNLNLNIPVKYLVYGTRKHLFTYLFKFGFNCIKSLIIFIQFKPDYIITTGAHTSVPLVYIAKIFGKQVIYIESIARLHTKSMAGSMIENKADLFIVQWESMLKVYPKAEYHGQIL